MLWLAVAQAETAEKFGCSSGSVSTWAKQAGADKGAHSEHGTHKAGEIVETEHAAILIERGFAEPA